jgi:hypothetical protein
MPLPARQRDTTALGRSSTVSISGGGLCLRDDRSSDERFNQLIGIARQRYPKRNAPLAIALMLDENCNVVRDTIIAWPHGPDWTERTVFDAAFPGSLPLAGRNLGIATIPTRTVKGVTEPGIFVSYGIVPSRSWVARHRGDECGFGSRAGERCTLDGTVVIRRLDSVRVLIAVRGAPVKSNEEPTDHMFLVTALTPLPVALSQTLKFGHVAFKNGEVLVEDRASTATPYLFGADVSGSLANPPRPLTRFDRLIGIAHYRSPVVRIEEVPSVRRAAQCEGPLGSCFEVNGRVFEFPG